MAPVSKILMKIFRICLLEDFVINYNLALVNELVVLKECQSILCYVSDAIFVVCSQTFTLFRLIKTAVPVEISRYSFRVFSCACPTVISSISGKSFHFPFPYFVICYVSLVFGVVCICNLFNWSSSWSSSWWSSFVSCIVRKYDLCKTWFCTKDFK